jgi:TatD DNase family protein
MSAGQVRYLPDSHCHLSMVSRAVGASVVESHLHAPGGPILDPGVEADDLAARVDAWGSFDRVRFACGAWPSAAHCGSLNATVSVLRQALASGVAVAVGECGLDYHWMEADERSQRTLFDAQIGLATEAGVPVIVHSRDAFDDTLAAVRAHPGTRFVLHCFSYGPKEAEALLDLDAWISFAGQLTYPKAESIREACRIVPARRLLLETDAPYLAPIPMRGKGCAPAFIAYTYARAAEIRGSTVEELAVAVRSSMDSLFCPQLTRPN